MSSSTETITLCCTSCSKQCSSPLVEVYYKSWKETQDAVKAPYKLCGSCLVGTNVPVMRPLAKRWEIGSIEEYNPESKKHKARFLDSDVCEEVEVVEQPFLKYAELFSHLMPPPKTKLRYNHMSSSARRGPILMRRSPEDRRGNERYTRAVFRDTVMGDNDSHHDDSLSILKQPTFKLPADFDEASTDNEREDYQPKISLTPSFVNTLDDEESAEDRSPAQTPERAKPPKKRLPVTPSPPNLNSGGRLWTTEEDKILLQLVAEFEPKAPAKNNERGAPAIRWSELAKDISGRTGKQCRERYLNHLTPTLNKQRWSATEDAEIFRMYALNGSKWSKMCKTLTGRTDNGIKNRFHHVNRRLERALRGIPTTPELDIAIEKVKKQPANQNLDNVSIRYLACYHLKKNHDKKLPVVVGPMEHVFGPFVEPENYNTHCSRCGLSLPSKETGGVLCKRTGWCIACTGVATCISGDALRSAHGSLE